jgi:hypothetical protein
MLHHPRSPQTLIPTQSRRLPVSCARGVWRHINATHKPSSSSHDLPLIFDFFHVHIALFCVHITFLFASLCLTNSDGGIEAKPPTIVIGLDIGTTYSGFTGTKFIPPTPETSFVAPGS